MRNFKFLTLAFAALFLSATFSACNKDDDDNDNDREKHCYEFVYLGQVLTQQCDITESQAQQIVDKMREQGYDCTARRADGSSSGNNNNNNNNSTGEEKYCYEFIYQGQVVAQQCDITESDAQQVIVVLRKQGYDCTARRVGGSSIGNGNGNGSENENNNPINNEFTWTLTNNTNQPFKLYVDDSFIGNIAKSGTFTRKIKSGKHTFKAVQTSGFFEEPYEQAWNNNGDAYNANANYTATIDTPKGIIKLVNNAKNSYYVYLDGVQQSDMGPQSTKEIKVDAWKTYKVRVKQKNGYIFYPSEYEYSIDVDAKYRYTRTFTNN